jgi:SAM-dependent methyltransferase
MAKALSIKPTFKNILSARVKQWLHEQNFHPNILGIFTNPFYIARINLKNHIKKLSVYLNGEILDIGCGQKPYRRFFNCKDYVGLEIDSAANRNNKQADYYYDGKTFPFPDGHFDSIMCNQVFEHVFTPNDFLEEMSRVLKTNGTVLLTVPFMWDEHEQPFDYARYTSFALKEMFLKNGFEIITLQKSVPNLAALFQMLNAYIYKILFTKNGKINLILSMLICGPITLLGILFGKLFPSNQDLYLDNIVLAKKIYE